MSANKKQAPQRPSTTALKEKQGKKKNRHKEKQKKRKNTHTQTNKQKKIK